MIASPWGMFDPTLSDRHAVYTTCKYLHVRFPLTIPLLSYRWANGIPRLKKTEGSVHCRAWRSKEQSR